MLQSQERSILVIIHTRVNFNPVNITGLELFVEKEFRIALIGLSFADPTYVVVPRFWVNFRPLAQ